MLKLKKTCLLSFMAFSLVSSSATTVLNDESLEAFQRDGYLVLSNLLDADTVVGLAQAGEQIFNEAPKMPNYFSTTRAGAMFGTNNCTKDEIRSNKCEVDDITSAFRKTALFSKLPQAAAELMQLDPESQNVRILRDIFLAKGVHEDKVCDWHVDDLGFWPSSYQSEASQRTGKDQNGINVWVALDDMPALYHGSMAVSPGSHRAEWRHDAYNALGQNRSSDGGKSKEEIRRFMAERTTQHYLTCDMHLVEPDMYEHIEKTGKILDIKKGDVIFSTRLLFHRTLSVTPEGRAYYDSINKESLNRYSIRYVPGTSRLPNGWNVEWSVMNNPENTGHSLDEIVEKDGLVFYPEVWPRQTDATPENLNQIASMIPQLSEMARAELTETLFGGSAATMPNKTTNNVQTTDDEQKEQEVLTPISTLIDRLFRVLKSTARKPRVDSN